MVRLTRIYTRTGDSGDTRLVDGSSVRKGDPRVEAYGDVDEANSAIGVALAAGGLPEEVARVLAVIQNEMFDLGADLANPLHPDSDRPDLRVTAEYVDRLERQCDHFSDPLPALKSFILPGGSLAAAQLHVARTIARRAERAAWLALSAGVSTVGVSDEGISSVGISTVPPPSRPLISCVVLKDTEPSPRSAAPSTTPASLRNWSAG